MLSELVRSADANDIDIDEGTLCILNITAGDIKVSFNKDDPEEAARAREMIEDMLKRGYSILVQWGDGWRRAKKFIPSRDSYVIEVPKEGKEGEVKPKMEEKEIPAKKTRAVGVAPTAGG